LPTAERTLRAWGREEWSEVGKASSAMGSENHTRERGHWGNGPLRNRLPDSKDGAGLQGDEALTMNRGRTSHLSGDFAKAKGASESPSLAHWYALYTRSRCEQLVYNQLATKGFHVFLPKLEMWSRRAGEQHLSLVPIFPSYLFLHHTMDKLSYIEVRKARGLVRILGERWDRLSMVPDVEMEAIQRVLRSRLPALPYPYLKEGQYIRITHGTLAGVEGILVHSKPGKGRLVLSVDLLRRSVAVEVDCSGVVSA
jgi:transcription termination/antitermination protein NusG